MKRRKTETKTAILEQLKKSHEALSHEMLQSTLKGNIDRATIYRILNRFYEDGIVHRIVGDDGKQYFALCINCQESKHHHNHFHFRCKTCGKVECLSNEISIQLPKGYVAENFNGVISGLCTNCA